MYKSFSTFAGTCDKKPLFGKPYLYKQWIESGHWVEMLCAPGTLFDDNDCGCTMRSTHMTSLGVRAIAKESMLINCSQI